MYLLSIHTGHKVCGVGEWTVAEGTATKDTVCRACGKGTFRSQSATDNKAEKESDVCIAHKTCKAGEWTEAEGDSKTDTKCTACNKGYFRSTAPKGNTKEREAGVCIAHKTCKAGEWTKAVGTATTDTTCAKCASGTARPKAPANSLTAETASACSACVGKAMYSDEEGLAQCKQCPGGHFGVVAAGSKAAGGHKACDDATCERPTSLPANAMVVGSQCPGHGKHKQICMMSCKDGFHSSASNTPFTCAPDGQATTASYQGGNIVCSGAVYVAPHCGIDDLLLCWLWPICMHAVLTVCG